MGNPCMLGANVSDPWPRLAHTVYVTGGAILIVGYYAAAANILALTRMNIATVHVAPYVFTMNFESSNPAGIEAPRAWWDIRRTIWLISS